MHHGGPGNSDRLQVQRSCGYQPGRLCCAKRLLGASVYYYLLFGHRCWNLLRREEAAVCALACLFSFNTCARGGLCCWSSDFSLWMRMQKDIMYVYIYMSIKRVVVRVVWTS